jgi:hypothetical protein
VPKDWRPRKTGRSGSASRWSLKIAQATARQAGSPNRAGQPGAARPCRSIGPGIAPCRHKRGDSVCLRQSPREISTVSIGATPVMSAHYVASKQLSTAV